MKNLKFLGSAVLFLGLAACTPDILGQQRATKSCQSDRSLSEEREPLGAFFEAELPAVLESTVATAYPVAAVDGRDTLWLQSSRYNTDRFESWVVYGDILTRVRSITRGSAAPTVLNEVHQGLLDLDVPIENFTTGSLVDTWARPKLKERIKRRCPKSHWLDLAVEIQPWIHTRMNYGLRSSVEVAYEIAAQRVQEVESCSRLFAELGADAVQILGGSYYWPVISYRDAKQLCDGRNAAFTLVGSPMVFVCDEFERLSYQDAATIIIHEALHTAGLKERPQYRGIGVKTSREISSMVAKNCLLTGTPVKSMKVGTHAEGWRPCTHAVSHVRHDRFLD
jgi:hypothetical protein